MRWGRLDRGLVIPVEGPLYSGVYDPDRDETRSRYLVFSVPRQAPLGELTVEWTNSDDVTRD